MMTDPGFLSELEYSRKHEEEVQRLKVEAELNQFNKEKDSVLLDLKKLKNLLHDISESSSLIKSIEDIELYITRELNSPIETAILNYIESRLPYINKDIETFKDNDLQKNIFYSKVTAELAAIQRAFEIYRNSSYSFQTFVKAPFEATYKEILDELRLFRKSRAIADSARTENFYYKAVEKYTKLENNYRKYFYWGIFVIIIFTGTMFRLKRDLIKNEFITEIDFWIIKISFLVLSVTLITYFIKQSNRYQKLADQNYQTQIELQAYPSYMESIPTSEAAAIRKELALKYFGREIDKDSSISNGLLTDQIKASTDLVKASTEIVKNVK